MYFHGTLCLRVSDKTGYTQTLDCIVQAISTMWVLSLLPSNPLLVLFSLCSVSGQGAASCKILFPKFLWYLAFAWIWSIRSTVGSMEGERKEETSLPSSLPFSLLWAVVWQVLLHLHAPGPTRPLRAPIPHQEEGYLDPGLWEHYLSLTFQHGFSSLVSYIPSVSLFLVGH